MQSLATIIFQCHTVIFTVAHSFHSCACLSYSVTISLPTHSPTFPKPHSVTIPLPTHSPTFPKPYTVSYYHLRPTSRFSGRIYHSPRSPSPLRISPSPFLLFSVSPFLRSPFSVHY